jgi:hypothetical protein
MNIGAEIVYQHDLYFDSADTRNGSLYLCVPPGTPAIDVEDSIARLRAAGLWSNEPHKMVPENHKKNYAEQMRFVACAQFDNGGRPLLAARYDHPKFPSDAARWSDWLATLGA